MSMDSVNGYEAALEAAGATVHVFKEFGSYQGDWWAYVTLHDGRAGWVRGSYGSCSWCDAFERELGEKLVKCEDHQWLGEKAPAGCAACAAKLREATDALRRFGANYLDGLMTREAAITQASEDLDWDTGAQEMVEFIAAFRTPTR